MRASRLTPVLRTARGWVHRDGNLVIGGGFAISEAAPAGADDLNEHASRACDNGLDDDLDGTIDWREDTTGDPQCDSLSDNRESPPPHASCGLGPELAILVTALLAFRRRLES